MSDEEAQEHFDNFFEDVFIELEDKYGEIEEMNVCDNLGDHLVGNVYVKVCSLIIVSTILLKTSFILLKTVPTRRGRREGSTGAQQPMVWRSTHICGTVARH
jgi:hypothetical protein